LKNVKNNELSDRRAAAAQAKTTLLNAYHAAKTAAEPDKLARQAERMAIAGAKEERRLERERAKLEERERVLAEAADRQAVAAAAARAEAEAREALEKNRIALAIEDEATRKAERDRRYANRKARQA
jgi:hypothetical protein